jgi:hypothetical protein
VNDDADLAFARTLSQILGSLYRLSVVDHDGGVVGSYGHGDHSDGIRSTLRLPNSSLGAIATLDSALDELIRQGEAHIGKRLPEMSRSEKQQLVRFLHERGAFNLRKAVERVAELLSVSRFTVYNYLDANRGT